LPIRPNKVGKEGMEKMVLFLMGQFL